MIVARNACGPDTVCHVSTRIMQAAKQALLAAIPNAKSDHLAVVVAFDAWQRALDSGGRSAGGAFCAKHFISSQA